jgi:hypothetical protein
MCFNTVMLTIHGLENSQVRSQESQIREGQHVRGLLEKYPTFGREKETGLLGALDT